jgi:hypothetical protein
MRRVVLDTKLCSTSLVPKGVNMNPENDQVVTSDGISRRKMLKRIGAGAAIAWSAPVLTSIRTPAFAQSAPGEGCGDCGPLVPCGAGGTCGCFPSLPSRACHCGELFSGACADFAKCNPDGSGCPAGTACVTTCCDQQFGEPPVCMPDCGSGAQAQSGPRTGNRLTTD